MLSRPYLSALCPTARSTSVTSICLVPADATSTALSIRRASPPASRKRYSRASSENVYPKLLHTLSSRRPRSSSVRDRSLSTRERDSSGAVTSKDGFLWSPYKVYEPLFEGGEQGVLLVLVEPVDLVHKYERPASLVLETPTGTVQRGPEILYARHGAQRHELFFDRVRQHAGQSRLPCAGRSPEDDRADPAPLRDRP